MNLSEETRSQIELRPQPVGIFPHAAAHLLLPPVRSNPDESDPALRGLLAGDLTIQLPDEWEFFRVAAHGDPEAARQLIEAEDGEISAYNQFVLDPNDSVYQQLLLRFSGELKELLQIAAFAIGLSDQVPNDPALSDELLAIALATQAAAAMEEDDLPAARSLLSEATTAARGTSATLASMLLAQQAELMQSMPGIAVGLVMQIYREAIVLAQDCRLPLLLSNLYLQMGMVMQNASHGQRGALLEAVRSYQLALQNGITEADHPELFAQVQNNLGLAYLSMPNVESSHQLRTGVAVQSFRHALRIYQIETHPDLWASVSMNLANALQYAPSSHPQENLIQAVEIYDQVLQVRSRAKDPVAYAIVLLNQANALAHLGIFRPALEKISESYKLFHWYEEVDKASVARELLENINQQMGIPNESSLSHSENQT
jgi:tetratricopeptide (TPR) repeat protein